MSNSISSIAEKWQQVKMGIYIRKTISKGFQGTGDRDVLQEGLRNGSGKPQ
jgi:hypothetical protein